MRLYEIPAHLRLAADYVHVDEETGEILGRDEFENLRIEAHEKCLSVAKLLKELRYESDALLKEERIMAQRRKNIEAKCNYFSQRLDEAMKALGEQKLSDAQVAISYRKNPVSALIQCEVSDLPDEFKKVKVEADKIAIRDALKEGKQINGCSLQQTVSVVIK